LGWGVCGIETAAKPRKIGQKTGPEIVFSGAPGRGVLRFLAGGYRRPVHNLGFLAIFSENGRI